MSESLPQGLFLIRNFIEDEEEALLVAKINENQWSGQGIPPNPEMKRRGQQYGGLFCYMTRSLTKLDTPLPDWIESLCRRVSEAIFTNLGISDRFDFVCINEYTQGQGIMPHVDSLLFGPTIVSLSLLEQCEMAFEPVVPNEHPPSRFIFEPRSILVMTQESRYKFLHSVSKSSICTKRIAIIFRSLLADGKSCN